MDREELRALIARAVGRGAFDSELNNFDLPYADGSTMGRSISAADAILTALDEAGFQCVKWLTTEELEASTVPAGYQIWTNSIYCDRSKDRHMIVASPYRKDEK